MGRIPQFDDWVEQRVLPTLKQLEEFAKKTYTPFGHLFLAEPPNERIPIPDMRTLGDTEVERPSAIFGYHLPLPGSSKSGTDLI